MHKPPDEGLPIHSVTLNVEAYHDQISAFRARFGAGEMVDVKVESTPYRVMCRGRTTDIDVVFETFHGLYHLPAGPLPVEPVIVDLGSNIGSTLMHYGAIFPRARLIGVEMDPGNVALARHNTAPLGERCNVFEAAIALTDGEACYTGEDAYGYHLDLSGNRVTKTMKMSTLIQQNGVARIDFLKVDIEGAESDLFTADLNWLDLVSSLYVENHGGEEELRRLMEIIAARNFIVSCETTHWSAFYGLNRKRPGS